MTKFLDLRKKIEPQVKVVYKTVVKQQPWYLEVAKVLAVIAIVTTVVWGVSKADESITPAPISQAQPQTFSVMGLVSATTPTFFSIDSFDPAVNKPAASYNFDISSIKKIETNEYVPLQFSDIKVGDKIIVDGVVNNYSMVAQHIFSFTSIPSPEVLASTSPELTGALNVNSSTNDSASSTASSTPSVIEDVVDVIKDTVQNIVNTVIGSTTPEATTTEAISTTTDQVVSPTTSTEIIPAVPPIQTSDASST